MQHINQHERSTAFGAHLRNLREARLATDSSFSLRKFAARCDVTAAYLSRVERGEVPPPSEDTLTKLANELGEDRDVFLALAGKVSTDLQAAILARPALFSNLIRSIKAMPDHAVLSIVREVRNGNW